MPQDLIDPEKSWTEKKLQSTIKAAALECGYKYYHTQVSLYSARGFPDLVMVRNGRLLLWELKGPHGKPTPAQLEWIEALKQVPGVDARIVTPDDLDNAYQALVIGEWPK
jgi:hypothetical protein